MKNTIIKVFALALGLLLGCSSRYAAQHTDADIVQDTVDTYSSKNIDFFLANELCHKQMETLGLTKAESYCANKVNNLAFSMLHQIAKDHEDSSFVVSPMSLNCAMAIAGNGAAGKTRQEIERLVGPIVDANSFFKKYHAALPHNDYSNCSILNFLAVNPKYPIKEAFTKSIATIYDACVKSIDFANPQSVKQINDWFCQQLHDESANVMKPDAETSLLLANVMDFRAFWYPPFNREFTSDGNFTTDKGDVLQIPMMYQENSYLYTENASFQAVSLPYLGSCFKMLLVLPKSEKLSKFSTTMTPNALLNILNSLKREDKVKLSMPRFRCVCDMDVKEILTKTVPSAFDAHKANFSAICALPTWMNKISHRTSIEVTEQGTKARSITVESFLTKAETKSPEFRATHPFLYFVYDDATHAILLIGQFCGDGAIYNEDNN